MIHQTSILTIQRQVEEGLDSGKWFPGYKKRMCVSDTMTEHPKKRQSVTGIEGSEAKMLTCDVMYVISYLRTTESGNVLRDN